MFTKYVPILRWKSGEKNCLENLSPNVFGNIIPFIEVSPPSDSNNEYNVPIDVDINFDPYPILWTLENAPIPIRGHQTVPLLKQIPYCGHTPCPSG